MSELTKNLREEFKDKETRHIYAEDFLNTLIATQLKVLREDHEWTQTQLAQEAGMQQERISVLENINYESWSVKTLKRLAKALDVRLSIKFESFGSFLKDFDSFNRETLQCPSFEDDPAFQEKSAEDAASSAAIASSTPASHLRLINSPMMTTAATQRSLAFSLPVALEIESGKATTANQPLSVAETTPSMYRATA
ncbi:MAG: hypothetical protein QOH71_1958 [Blastocatellia bacterium]|jgi:transcriptional regulator with XRE-family HTH domain|nr:hypothetical protein [Blastocatellia bacterium]